MKICATVEMFNPFHNGHLYLFANAIKKTLSNALVAFMPGTISNTGELSYSNRFERAEWAIKGGADLVFEIPLVFCLSSPEAYLNYCINALKQIGATSLAFYSGFENFEDLSLNIEQSAQSTKDFSTLLADFNLKKGSKDYLDETIHKKKKYDSKNTAKNAFVFTSNQSLPLLAKKLNEKQKSQIEIVLIKEYNNQQSEKILTSSELRKKLRQNIIPHTAMPPFVKFDLLSKKAVDKFILDFLKEASQKTNSSPILKQHCEKIQQAETLSSILSQSLTRQDALRLAIVEKLSIKETQLYQNYKKFNYLRVLQSNNIGDNILKELKNNSTFNVLMADELPTDSKFSKILDLDNKADKLLQSLLQT